MAQFCREISGFIAESSSRLWLCIGWHGKRKRPGDADNLVCVTLLRSSSTGPKAASAPSSKSSGNCVTHGHTPSRKFLWLVASSVRMLISTSNEISSSSSPHVRSPRPASHSTQRKKKKRVCYRLLCPKYQRIRSREPVDSLELIVDNCSGSRAGSEPGPLIVGLIVIGKKMPRLWW
jgi:hypothetical protein